MASNASCNFGGALSGTCAGFQNAAAAPVAKAVGVGNVVAATRQSVDPAAACCPAAAQDAAKNSPKTGRPMRCMPNVYSGLWRRQLKSTIFNRLRHLDILHCGSQNS